MTIVKPPITPRDLRIVEAEKAHWRGWGLIPLSAKVPIVRWKDRSRDTLEQTLDWAAHHNLALRCGALSGVDVLDVDLDKGGVLPRGLPATVTVRTGSGGLHLYFQHAPGLRNSTGKLAPHVDFKTDGGLACFPGSVHPRTGRTYRWEPGCSPDDCPLAPLPRWVYDRLAYEPQQPEHRPFTGPPDEAVRRCRAYMAKVDPAIEGQAGQATLWKACRRIVEAGLANDHGFDILREYNARCVPPFDDAYLVRTWRRACGGGR